MTAVREVLGVTAPARAPVPGGLAGYAVLAVPVVVLSVVPSWQFAHWSWICLTLAAPVVVRGGGPRSRRAAGALRRGSCDDDLPFLLATAGALAWSVVALMTGPAGGEAWTQAFPPDPAGPPIRLDVAAGAVLAVLLAAAVAERPPAGPGRARRAVVPIVLAIAAGGLGYRLGAGHDAGAAVSATLAVLLVAAPSAFDARDPARRASDPRVVARRVDTVLITSRVLRSGPRRVTGVHPAAGADPDEVLRLAGSVTGPSGHPVARAVVAAAAGHDSPAVAEFDERRGLGVSGLVAELRTEVCDDGGGAGDDRPDADPSDGVASDGDAPAGAAPTPEANDDEADREPDDEADPGPDVDAVDDPGADASSPPRAISNGAGVTVVAHAVLAGHPDLLAEHGIALPEDLESARREAEEAGGSVVAVAWDGEARGVLTVAADPSPDAVDAVRTAHHAGLVAVLASGPIAASTADAAGVGGEPGNAQVPASDGAPDEAGTVAVLRAQGRVVAVVGAAGDDDAALDAADLRLGVGADDTPGHPGARDAVDALCRLRRAPGPTPVATVVAAAFHVVALPAAALGAVDPLLAGVVGAGVAAAAAVVRSRDPGPAAATGHRP